MVAFGSVASLSVELIQYSFLSARSAQTLDIVANISGALAGALVGELVRGRRVRSRP